MQGATIRTWYAILCLHLLWILATLTVSGNCFHIRKQTKNTKASPKKHCICGPAIGWLPEMRCFIPVCQQMVRIEKVESYDKTPCFTAVDGLHLDHPFSHPISIQIGLTTSMPACTKGMKMIQDATT